MDRKEEELLPCTYILIIGAGHELHSRETFDLFTYFIRAS